MSVPDHLRVFPQTVESEDHPPVTINPGAVETDRGLLFLLVDSGFPGELAQLEANLEDAGFALDDVWGVALTHPECAKGVDGREHRVSREADQERYPASPVHIEVTDGSYLHTRVGRIEVVHTPGHAPGHLSYYLPDADFLFSGDALHAPEGDLDGPRYPQGEAAAVESMRRLADREFDTTLTQHGGLVEEGSEAVAAAVPDDE